MLRIKTLFSDNAISAFLERAEVFALRAEVWFEELRYSPEDEPVLADDHDGKFVFGDSNLP
ncbi:MAG: hypothetical protein HC940_09305 [Acaryochloris sp. SU_5_25]|nr:hypothetical protein [Acaryochloris sp. SU_5_25]NJR55975.1 hypothetical protein [Acaryochloris sp. CRU_2_0]